MEKLKNLNNKTKIILLITIITLSLLVIGSTIAYFGWVTSNEQESSISVTVTGSGSCSLVSDSNTVLIPTSSKEGGRIIKLNAKQEMSSDASIVWNMKINEINALQNPTFKYELVNSTTGESYGTGTFENIAAGSTLAFQNINEVLKYNKDYNFDLYLWIDGNEENDLSMTNQKFDFDMNCTITVEQDTLATTITNLYTPNDTAENGDTTSGIVTYNLDTEHRLMYDRLGGTTTDYNSGNLRYYGADDANDPDDLKNYIYFNCDDYSAQTSSTCETWRIIGVFDGKVKIMRDTSLGVFSWDYDYNDGGGLITYNNDWTKSSLNTLLNGAYYNNEDTQYYNNSTTPTDVKFETNKTGIKNAATQKLISDTLYYLGELNDNSRYPAQIYTYERGSTTYQNSMPTTWLGKIALAYPSDYGYAVDLGKCNKKIYMYSSDTEEQSCKNNNWMNKGTYYWLLTPVLDSSYYAFVVRSSGEVDSSSFRVIYAFGVPPVLYLESITSVKAGDGSSDNPFQIAVVQTS